MSELQARFDVGALRRLAGDKVFARGEAYHREGRVEILAVEGARVLAHVVGIEDYRTELTASTGAVRGECSCPAFEDTGFCKHMVAAALAANALTGDQQAEVAGALTRIREHLRQQSVDDLADKILWVAERDPGLFYELDAAAGGRRDPLDRRG